MASRDPLCRVGGLAASRLTSKCPETELLLQMLYVSPQIMDNYILLNNPMTYLYDFIAGMHKMK